MKLMNLKGTNDFLPKDQIIRNKIIDILKKNFENNILSFADKNQNTIFEINK